ncbi:MAG: DUF1800 family protein [Actinomycetota bacterium]
MIEFATTREAVAFLARRAGWGLAPGQLDDLEARGVAGTIDLLVDPTGAGVAEETSAWADWDFDYDRSDQEASRAQTLEAFQRWTGRLVETERPLDHQLAWFWHDHFAVSLQVVRHLPSMLEHLERCWSLGRGDFVELIRAITTDAAMLVFLDGATSTGQAPNENYGRELLELYTVGVNNFTEADVRAAAVALTGWTVRPRFDWEVRYVPNRHDDTPQTLLGVDGVHDVDGVVAAATAHPACPVFIATKLGRYLLGAVDNATIFSLADRFAASDLDIATLTRAALEAGSAGAAGPTVLAPLPWMTQAVKATGSTLEPRFVIGQLRTMGQLPANPPNVGGYPGTATWLASSATAGRFTAANAIARATPDDAVALSAARDRSWDELADLLVRPAGFSPATLAALADLSPSASDRPGEAALALALASPDLLVA